MSSPSDHSPTTGEEANERIENENKPEIDCHDASATVSVSDNKTQIEETQTEEVKETEKASKKALRRTKSLGAPSDSKLSFLKPPLSRRKTVGGIRVVWRTSPTAELDQLNRVLGLPLTHHRSVSPMRQPETPSSDNVFSEFFDPLAVHARNSSNSLDANFSSSAEKTTEQRKKSLKAEKPLTMPSVKKLLSIFEKSSKTQTDPVRTSTVETKDLHNKELHFIALPKAMEKSQSSSWSNRRDTKTSFKNQLNATDSEVQGHNLSSQINLKNVSEKPVPIPTSLNTSNYEEFSLKNKVRSTNQEETRRKELHEETTNISRHDDTDRTLKRDLDSATEAVSKPATSVSYLKQKWENFLVEKMKMKKVTAPSEAATSQAWNSATTKVLKKPDFEFADLELDAPASSSSPFVRQTKVRRSVKNIAQRFESMRETKTPSKDNFSVSNSDNSLNSSFVSRQKNPLTPSKSLDNVRTKLFEKKFDDLGQVAVVQSAEVQELPKREPIWTDSLERKPSVRDLKKRFEVVQRLTAVSSEEKHPTKKVELAVQLSPHKSVKKEEFQNVNLSEVSYLSNEVTNISNEVTNISNEVTNISNEVTELKTEMKLSDIQTSFGSKVQEKEVSVRDRKKIFTVKDALKQEKEKDPNAKISEPVVLQVPVTTQAPAITTNKKSTMKIELSNPHKKLKAETKIPLDTIDTSPRTQVKSEPELTPFEAISSKILEGSFEVKNSDLTEPETDIQKRVVTSFDDNATRGSGSNRSKKLSVSEVVNELKPSTVNENKLNLRNEITETEPPTFAKENTHESVEEKLPITHKTTEKPLSKEDSHDMNAKIETPIKSSKVSEHFELEQRLDYLPKQNIDDLENKVKPEAKQTPVKRESMRPQEEDSKTLDAKANSTLEGLVSNSGTGLVNEIKDNKKGDFLLKPEENVQTADESSNTDSRSRSSSTGKYRSKKLARRSYTDSLLVNTEYSAGLLNGTQKTTITPPALTIFKNIQTTEEPGTQVHSAEPVADDRSPPFFMRKMRSKSSTTINFKPNKIRELKPDELKFFKDLSTPLSAYQNSLSNRDRASSVATSTPTSEVQPSLLVRAGSFEKSSLVRAGSFEKSSLAGSFERSSNRDSTKYRKLHSDEMKFFGQNDTPK